MSKSNTFHGFAYGILKERPAKLYPWSVSMREQLMKADMGVSYVVYISSMFFWTITAMVLTLVVSISLISIILPMLGSEFSLITTIIIEVGSPILVGAITFVIFWYYPNYTASNQKIMIDKNIVYTTNFMSIVSGAGASTEEVFLSLAEVGEVYSIKKSARTIIRDIEFLGLDIMTSLDTESKRTPSHEFATLLQGYISTMETGGDIGSYLATMSEQFMESRKRLRGKMINQLGLAGEVFIAALVALPVIMITLLSIMGFFGGQAAGGLSPSQLMMLIVYVMVPILATFVLVLIDSILYSW